MKSFIFTLSILLLSISSYAQTILNWDRVDLGQIEQQVQTPANKTFYFKRLKATPKVVVITFRYEVFENECSGDEGTACELKDMKSKIVEKKIKFNFRAARELLQGNSETIGLVVKQVKANSKKLKIEVGISAPPYSYQVYSFQNIYYFDFYTYADYENDSFDVP